MWPATVREGLPSPTVDKTNIEIHKHGTVPCGLKTELFRIRKDVIISDEAPDFVNASP